MGNLSSSLGSLGTFGNLSSISSSGSLGSLSSLSSLSSLGDLGAFGGFATTALVVLVAAKRWWRQPLLKRPAAAFRYLSRNDRIAAIVATGCSSISQRPEFGMTTEVTLGATKRRSSAMAAPR